MPVIKILFFAAIFSLISCGKVKPSGNDVDNTQYFKDRKKFEAALAKSAVVCGEYDLDCPDNVAKLTFWSETNGKFALSVCSGTLIDEEYILTNRHCIPENLIKVGAGASCNKQIVINFPDTKNSDAEMLDCIEIVQVFPDKEDQPDLAVLRVQKSTSLRSGTSLNKKPYTHRQEVYAYTMNPNPYVRMSGTIVRKECSISLDNFMTLKRDGSAGDVLLSGYNCKLIGGNSGSAIFNQAGEIVGVINKRIDNDVVKKIFYQNDISHMAFTNMGGAVNISCLNDLYLNAGKGCISNDLSSAGVSFENYLDEKLSLNNLQSENEDNIKVTFTGNLELELSVKNYVLPRERLSQIRPKLTRYYKMAQSVRKEMIFTLGKDLGPGKGVIK
ncbi:MAG: trypsin-like peptidase domain-containing protein [Halobacteriovoraceae bacterium]|jgi:hypothetical protein|nr:trypsin-like peptidase domain-containing protein [Halobacteriovoraceae bacterium]